MNNLVAAGIAQALGAITANLLKIHSGDPGAAGTNNELSGGSYAPVAVTLGAVAGNQLPLSNQPEVNIPASSTTSHWSLWQNATVKAIGQLYTKHSAEAGNDSGLGTITIKTTPVHASTPNAGMIYIDGDAYEYTGRADNVFTIVGTLSQDYAEDVVVLAPIPLTFGADGAQKIESLVINMV
ncbi:phage tail fiber protein [Bowmanella dokdonensis]|uniref:Uncharacterized protein n=1 Tax=Bowmanella dokdonensis TaxID=751969 RepID=A0A939DL91_9ALTE|nr:hypothetical protein [Bowmanella dokdonensis]MBN7824794.1 hypothetical protein [Bowmanella dokdonensis]